MADLLPRIHPDYDPDRLEQLVPVHLRGGLRRYIEQGVKPGDGLWAIVRNDSAFNVVARLDDEALAGLRDTFRFLHNHAPGLCWGSDELCESWRALGGLYGGGPADG